MPQSRKWQLTFNNPEEHGFTHEAIEAAIQPLAAVAYWCMCDETGSEGTYHTHLYIAFENPKSHTVIGNAFPGAHRENVKGTSQQNRDYVLKGGEKYNKQPDGTYDYTDSSGKRHQGTNHSDTFQEWGEMPQEHQGKAKGTRQSLLVLTERLTRYEIILRVRDKTARSTVHALDRIFPMFPHGTFKTITVDNGSEFQDCYGMEHDKHGNQRTQLYYCHPYCSSERGSNERANRIIRRFYPKGQSLEKITQTDCNKTSAWMNDLPRKILGYQTAADLFQAHLAAL